VDKQRVATCWIEMLGTASPTPVPATGCERHFEPIAIPAGARLDLHPERRPPVREISDQVVIRCFETSAPASVNQTIADNSPAFPCLRGVHSIGVFIRTHVRTRRGQIPGQSGPPTSLELPPARTQSTSRKRCASGSASSFFNVWFSIWRMRSRVTLNARPTSSSV